MINQTALHPPSRRRLRTSEVHGSKVGSVVELESAYVRVSIWSQNAADRRGHDAHYVSVCAGDVITRMAVTDITGSPTAAAALDQWVTKILEKRLGEFGSARVLCALNHEAADHCLDALATAVVATFYGRGRILTIASAGHPPALLWRKDQNRWESVFIHRGTHASSNIVLGMLDETEYCQEAFTNEPGDRLLLYSDGVIDTLNPQGEAFGLERLRETLIATTHLPLPQQREALTEALLRFQGDLQATDDRTLLLAELA